MAPHDFGFRRSTRMPDYDYRFGAFFFTLVTHNRVPLFGHIQNKQVVLSAEGHIVDEEWRKTPYIRREVELDEWMVMPDHFHAIVFVDGSKTGTTGIVGGACWRPCPLGEETIRDNTERIKSVQPGQHSLARIINQFKATTTKRIRQLKGTAEYVVWQRGYDEHIIRNEVELDKIRHYIRTNPERG